MNRFDLDSRTTYEASGHRVNPAFASKNRSAVTSVTGPAETRTDWPLIPWSRGPLSAAIIAALAGAPGDARLDGPVEVADVLRDDDFQLALYLSHEVRYRDFAGNDWEWDAGLLAFRARLEHIFMMRIREEVTLRHPRLPSQVADALDQLIFTSPSRSLPRHFLAHGNLDEVRELFVHRSASYAHDTASPHEQGRPRDDVRTEAFAATMTGLGLDASPGSYVEVVPGVTLAMVNLQSMFSLHRRWRAALVGHHAVSEMTSGGRAQKWGRTLARFGIVVEGAVDQDIDVDIDVDVDVHIATLARARVLSGLLGVDPSLEGDVLFGAGASLLLDQMFCDHLLNSWENHRSSLVPWELIE